MKIWFDTEFIEDGRTIDLISIGAVREDGAVFYAENAECDLSRASPWVRENVLPHLRSTSMLSEWTVTGSWPSEDLVTTPHIVYSPMRRVDIAKYFVIFAGEKPEFWAYYADYDWVALCQLYGTMMELPKGWPMYCRDVKQLCDDLGNPKLPKQTSYEHHALADAEWTREAWRFLERRRLNTGRTIP